MLLVAADNSNYFLDDVFTGLDSIKTNTRYKWASLMVLPRLTCGFPTCCNPDEAPKREQKINL
jgi:hypothetical protein